MSYRTFFLFAAGLAKPIHVPKDTKAGLLEHVEEVEKALGLKRVTFNDNPVHWDHWHGEIGREATDEVLCETVDKHNAWVRETHGNFAHWSEHPFTLGKGHQAEHLIDRAYPIGWPAETLAPDDAKAFWHGFEMLSVSPERWTEDYYRTRMETLYEVMRGRETEGISFDDVKPLTPKQAAAVINLFSEFLDSGDLRLDVPNRYDHLASSSDGGYEWCEECGPVHPDDVNLCRKRKCPLRAARKEMETE